MKLTVRSPLAGITVALSEVPDPVFAESMVGPGLAIKPLGGLQQALAPIDGTVATLHPHAFVVISPDGRAVLVHLGIDTVKRKGEGFRLQVVKGDSVRSGQPLVEWDPDAVSAAGYSPIVPVIALDTTAEALFDLHLDQSVQPGDSLLVWND